VHTVSRIDRWFVAGIGSCDRDRPRTIDSHSVRGEPVIFEAAVPPLYHGRGVEDGRLGLERSSQRAVEMPVKVQVSALPDGDMGFLCLPSTDFHQTFHPLRILLPHL
jgi:hypothetical protein